VTNSNPSSVSKIIDSGSNGFVYSSENPNSSSGSAVIGEGVVLSSETIELADSM
jgi:hypothetical protein